MELNTSASANTAEYSGSSSDTKFATSCNNDQFSVIRIPEDGEKSSKHSSKKQSKRRKKSSNHTRPLPRIIVKPLPPPPPPENREWTAALSYTESNTSKPSTMREVLASIPGFSIKPRKRSGKKLSTAAQLQQTREGCIDLETPDSILVHTNIRQLLNKHTFSTLPPLYQYKLGQLLPSVDRLSPSGRLNSSSLNNEFFARACREWQTSLSGGELTPESQQKMKSEAEKEKSKIDPWKLKHFEPMWGEKSRREKSSLGFNSERPSLKTTIKLRPTASITSSSTVPKIKKSKSSNSKRMRSVGAVTRSSSKTDDVPDESASISTKSSAPVPDLLPLKHGKHHNQTYEEFQVDCNFSDTSSVQRMDDSIATTPVDPLLLPDDSESNEMKQELDFTVVVEESNGSKDFEEDKGTDSDSNLQIYKRVSDDNERYNSAKRIKFEDENSLSQPEIAKVSYSDAEVHYDNEQICTNEEQYEPVQIDTNEYSKAVIYEYEIESPAPSLKHESNVVTETVTEEPISDSKVEETHNVDDEISPIESHSSPEQFETEIDGKKPLQEKCSIIEQETLETKHVESPIPNPVIFKNEINNTMKNEDKERIPQNANLNYYEERFKDAESFILETGLSSILTSQQPRIEDVKYIPHPNLMELSSYISEANVTAVVTMPLTQNSSIPVMEVANTPMVSYPDDNMQDAAKPKNSAVSWKTDTEWPNNENVITLHPFSNLNTDSAKYVSDDSKTSMDDININDENCMYKEDRDANYNMESSNSSESCQSMKETLKQDLEPVTSLVSSTTVTNPSVNSTTMMNVRPGKKSKMGKDSNRSRTSNKVPPGAVNLERSYQICQAVIQNSPNRDALRGQLRPPPALLTRVSRPPRPHPPPPVLLRQMPVSVMQHSEVSTCLFYSMYTTGSAAAPAGDDDACPARRALIRRRRCCYGKFPSLLCSIARYPSVCSTLCTLRGQLRPPPALLTRVASPPRPHPPVLWRQMPVSVMQHSEVSICLYHSMYTTG
ncbi:Polycomb protein Asx [Operophtera brumata]|uniref:Polycomb protein Asx n=1 Tax=Operophtera brumata TaxID=104452 RepID=A0A0L7KPH7_OPEBR|nr:Polycomb protein Asx [Operophtera brumata]